MGKERVILKHHANAALFWRHEEARPHDIAAIEAHHASIRLFEPSSGAQQGRLATTRMAEQAEDLTGKGGQRHVGNRNSCAELLSQANHLQTGFAHEPAISFAKIVVETAGAGFS